MISSNRVGIEKNHQESLTGVRQACVVRKARWKSCYNSYRKNDDLDARLKNQGLEFLVDFANLCFILDLSVEDNIRKRYVFNSIQR